MERNENTEDAKSAIIRCDRGAQRSRSESPVTNHAPSHSLKNRILSAVFGISTGLAGMAAMNGCSGGACSACLGCAVPGAGILLLVLMSKPGREKPAENRVSGWRKRACECGTGLAEPSLSVRRERIERVHGR